MDTTTATRQTTPTGDSGRETRPPSRRWLRAYPIFLVATGVLALHVIDDNYLQPNAGMSATDHLASGLVPLALLALGAWAYPRVRAGLAAVVSIAHRDLRRHHRRHRAGLLHLSSRALG